MPPLTVSICGVEGPSEVRPELVLGGVDSGSLVLAVLVASYLQPALPRDPNIRANRATRHNNVMRVERRSLLSNDVHPDLIARALVEVCDETLLDALDAVTLEALLDVLGEVAGEVGC